jgi:hypothetical protein
MKRIALVAAMLLAVACGGGGGSAKTNGDPAALCDYTLSAWSDCTRDQVQTRTVLAADPPGCVKPVTLSQACTWTCDLRADLSAVRNDRSVLTVTRTGGTCPPTGYDPWDEITCWGGQYTASPLDGTGMIPFTVTQSADGCSESIGESCRPDLFVDLFNTSWTVTEVSPHLASGTAAIHHFDLWMDCTDTYTFTIAL